MLIWDSGLKAHGGVCREDTLDHTEGLAFIFFLDHDRIEEEWIILHPVPHAHPIVLILFMQMQKLEKEEGEVWSESD